MLKATKSRGTSSSKISKQFSRSTMKELPHSRRKRPPNNHSPKKLKLVCSYNGSFQSRPPSGKLRYFGGETRIVSIDRNIGFLRLRSKISDLGPNTTSFCLRYQLPESDTPLVLIATDDDVRCMIEEYDRLELYSKHSRLWLYVCSNEDDFGNGLSGSQVRRMNCAKGVNMFESASDSRKCETFLSRFAQVDGDIVGKNLGVRSDDNSLRKIVLKQQLLAKQSSLIRGESQKDDNPLVNLGTDSQVPKKFEGGQCTKAFDNKIASIHMPRSGHSIMSTASHSHPLNPRDENLRVEANGPEQNVVGRCSQVFFNGSGSFCGSISTTQGLKQLNGFSMEHEQRKIEMVEMGGLNRENIMPLGNGCDFIKIHLSSECRGDNWACSQSSIRNHRFGVHDTRNQRFGPYNVRNHQSNMNEMGNHRAFRLDGRLSTAKCYPGLGPHSSIAKQGQSIRVNSWKHGSAFPQHVLGGKINRMDSSSSKANVLFEAPCSDEKLRQHRSSAFSGCQSANAKDCYLAYPVACNGLGTRNLFPSPCVRTMDNQTDLLTGSYYAKSKVTCETLYDNSNGVNVNFAPICFNNKEQLQLNPYMVAKTPGFPYNMAGIDGIGLGFSGNNRNGSKLQVLPERDSTSVNISFCNLSLSSFQDVEPQHKPVDLTDEGKFTQSAKCDKSNDVASSVSLQNAAKMDGEESNKEAVNKASLSGLSIDEKVKDKESRKSSKVIDRVSSDLASFYTHLATRELQTIKDSDLEYIKELGSGTYGTVFYGKWRGSDVAIKKIKPSCFTVGTIEEDRLIADFWKEAHILGQLHHPNIVAFYGVVRDGPVTNLATVTEYMVNGSLKQVLQRKDRTIDRRKRLIIAMDAAFGMEYLHDKGIVHFDLKSHNFLVNMRDPQRPVCKIGDLGLSKIKQKTLVSGGVRGTVPWMAPELLNSKEDLVTEKIDVYSFGIVMWELLTGEEPYEKMPSEEIIAGIIRGNIRPEIPSWCDPLWRSLMERCWSSNPDSRPSFSEIAKELRTMSAAMNIK